MDLLQAFAENKVTDVQPILKVIDTQLSRVFIGSNRVYKVYRRSAAFFGNLSDDTFRRKFYQEDFSWNQQMSPQVYLALRPVAFIDGFYCTVSDGEAQDFIIEMALVDTSRTLSALLLQHKVHSQDMERLIQVMSQRGARLTEEKKEEILQISKSWSKLYELRLQDLENFSALQSTIPRDVMQRAVAALRKHYAHSTYFREYSPDALGAGIDGHSDNVLLIGEDIIFIDVLLVEERWRPIDPFFDVCRLAVDIEAQGQPELLPVLYQAAKEHIKSVPDDVRTAYELSSAIIKGAYDAIIGKHDLALRHRPIIERLTAALDEQQS
jgi:aminoglycoside phosphotransferase family enzyme